MNRQLSPALELALEMMDRIGEAGLVVVPAEPSPEMIAAGIAVSDIGEQTVRAIYSAMIENG